MRKDLGSLGLLALFPFISYANNTQLGVIQVNEQMVSKTAASGLSSSAVISKQALERNKTNTLGETLDKVSGVQNNYFGPNVGRPIIRGLSGQRVQILQNDIPLQDMAAISGNLATSANLSSVEEIQIIKSGVSSILYGGKGMGGIVNLSDNSIPTKISEKSFAGEVNIQKGFNSANNYKVQLKGNNQKNWAWYLDASVSELKERKIPGKTKDAICYDYEYLKTNTELRRQCQVDIERVGSSINPKYYPYISKFYLDNYMDPDYGLSEGDKYTRDPGNRYRGINPPNPDYVAGSPPYVDNFGPAKEYATYPDGKIPNSSMRTKQMTIGSSYVADKGYIGAAFSNFTTEYGVPGFAYLTSRSAVQNQGYLPIRVKNETNRLNIKGATIEPMPWIAKTDFQISYQKSRDQEFLGGNLSNAFKSYSDYYRISIEHKPLFDRLVGTWGIEWNKHKVRTNGADSYLPKIDSKTQGIFLLEQLDINPFFLEVGQRWDSVNYNIDTTDRVTAGSTGGAYSKDKKFFIQNSHIGLLFQPQESWFIKLQRSWQERAPEINELYSDNSHYALLIEENGDGRLGKEKSQSWEVSTGLNLNNFTLEVTGFERKFGNFSYLGHTGISRNGLITKVWRQAPLRMKGVELDFTYQHDTSRLGHWTWHVFADYVKTKLALPPVPTDINAIPTPQQVDAKYLGSLPNIPTSRVGGNLTIQWKNWKGFIGATHYFKQNNVSKEVDEELKVDSFTLVDLGLSYTYPMQKANLEVSLNVRNLTNREARLNNSPLRFLAPLPGRNANLSMKLTF